VNAGRSHTGSTARTEVPSALEDQELDGASATGDPRHRDEREGRRLALGAVFEADFGQAPARRILERRISEEGASEGAAAHARLLVDAVVRYRDVIDAQIEQAAPAYPVVQLARMDRALLRSGMAELLHSPTTPGRVAISEWVDLARTYSGEPARRLLNGVLGRVAREAAIGGSQRPADASHDRDIQSEPNQRGSAE
jgi:transcription antitermination protein NusB